MIYEYRVYEAMPGKLPELHARFRNHTTKLFEKHGIKNIGYWTVNVGDYSDRLIYIIAFESAEQREKAWAAFRNDPEWQRVVNESQRNGLLVARVFNTLLTPTDYSPLR
jgi:hypothetical protein